MHIKLIEGTPTPYSIGKLRVDNPQVSFPNTIPDSTLAEYAVYPLKTTNRPEADYTKNVDEGIAAYEESEWVQVWNVTDASTEEIEKRTEEQANNVRADRDRKLTETDWVVIKSLETNMPMPSVWQSYRQALRDLPQQSGFPWDVQWPEQP